MSLHHAKPGGVVGVYRLEKDLIDSMNTRLSRSERLQVFRVVLLKGEEFTGVAPGISDQSPLSGERSR